jgi:hypothetical protein
VSEHLGDDGPDRDTAAGQLAALRADRAALAARIVQPWWWDVALGVLFAGFIASYSAHELWVIVAALVVFMLGLRGLIWSYKRITGVWWDAREVGPVQDRVRGALRLWAVGYFGLLAVGGAVEFLLGVRGAMVVVGAVLGVSVALSSRWVTRTYVAGLRAAP